MKGFFKHLIIGVLLAALSAGLLFAAKHYRESLGEGVSGVVDKYSKWSHSVFQSQLMSKQLEAWKIRDFLHTDNGLMSFLSLKVFLAYAILAIILTNIVGFFKDLFAFFPLGAGRR